MKVNFFLFFHFQNKTGDRILSLTISFRHVVYEDALTILSYASPYDVTMELEKGLRNSSSSTLKKRKTASTVSLASASPNAALSATAGSVQPEGSQNERLVHPLYRSQSIDDLSKVRTKKRKKKPIAYFFLRTTTSELDNSIGLPVA